MSGPHHQRKALVAAAAASVLLGAAAPAPAAGVITPLPASDYTTSSVCPAPTPGHASCMSEELVPQTAQAIARSHPLGRARTSEAAAPSPLAGSYGLRPQDLHGAYQLPTSASGAQTIAIVDAYNDPNAESDLRSYDQEFSLPACEAGCFSKVNQNGEASAQQLPFPHTAAELEAARKSSSSGERAEAEEATGWDLEISLDIETARAICQSCHILLVEASSALDGDLEAAERTAETLDANEISNSWGGPEAGESPALERISPFDHPGTVITASAGDDGYLAWDAERADERGYAEFPASSPHVVAVGGTRLEVSVAGAWTGESVWNGDGAGGGGCSIEFAAPYWQSELSGWSSVGCPGHRAVADVSADADPYTGLAVHDTSPRCEHRYEEEVGGKKVQQVAHWCTIGGTSLSSPLIAAVFALAGGSGGTAYPARSLYADVRSTPGSVHDVTSGSNGECLKPFDEEEGPDGGLSGCSSGEEGASCEALAICVARAGYDGPSGLGTPAGLSAFAPSGEGGRERPEESGEEREEGAPVEGRNPFKGPGFEGPTGPGSSTGPTSPAGGATTASTVQLTGLELTLKAVLALNHSRPKLSQVAFSFSVNAAASIHVALTHRLRSHRRLTWRTLPGSFTINVPAPGGFMLRHLIGRGVLTRGIYRLVLVPQHGTQRVLQFQIG